MDGLGMPWNWVIHGAESQSHGEMYCGQERLDLLVRWCQLIGLVPFRMERDAESGRFLSFSFSWRHPLTYWWLSSKILYVVALYFNMKSVWEGKFVSSTEEPIGVKMIDLISNNILHFTAFITPEILVSRWALFSKASRILGEFDTMIEKLDFPSCSTRKRSVIGIVSISLMVLISVIDSM